MNIPVDSSEAHRLAALHRYQVLDSAREQEYDDIAVLAKEICGTSMALISLVDETRQWFKAAVGLSVQQTPRGIAFCNHAIEQRGVFIVPDATQDARFDKNPLVTQDPNLRFYAGAPIQTPDGHILGTVCVLDRTPRLLSASQERALQALSRQVMRLLEFRRVNNEQRLEQDKQAATNVGLLFDVTARTAERDTARGQELIARADAERVQLALAAGAIIGTWAWDVSTDRFTVDEAFARHFGLDPALGREGIPLAQIVANVHPDDKFELAAAIDEALARGGRYAHQYRVRHRDGNYYWLEASGEVETDTDGRAVRFPGVLIDIEGRRAAAVALRESESRYRALFENIDAGFCICEVKFDEAGRAVDHRVLEANPAFERHTGLSNAVGRYANEVAPGIEQHWHDAYGQVALTGQPVRFEGEAKPLGRWYDAHLFPAGGGCVAMLIADITARRKAEAGLKEINETLEHRVAQRTE